MRGWRKNAGVEALACLSPRRFLLFRERSPGADGTSALLLSEGDPATPGTRFRRLRYRGPPGYKPTDAAVLAPGTLLVLHRRLGRGGLSGVLSVARFAGGVLVSRPLAAFRARWPTDNLEALALTDQGGGAKTLWLAADDNFNPAQRTLLIRLAIEPAGEVRPPGPRRP